VHEVTRTHSSSIKKQGSVSVVPISPRAYARGHTHAQQLAQEVRSVSVGDRRASANTARGQQFAPSFVHLCQGLELSLPGSLAARPQFSSLHTWPPTPEVHIRAAVKYSTTVVAGHATSHAQVAHTLCSDVETGETAWPCSVHCIARHSKGLITHLGHGCGCLPSETMTGQSKETSWPVLHRRPLHCTPQLAT
jgi:hypothetical protein